jgi:FtsH-binding integral membrane protein
MSLFTLKNTLIIDAITCTGLFVFCVFATATVATLLGLPSDVVTVAGWIGLPSALLMLFVANQKEPNKGLANLIAVGNLGWVIASFAVLAMFAGQMTAIGIAVIIVQAIGVLVFAIYEAKGAATLPRTITV